MSVTKISLSKGTCDVIKLISALLVMTAHLGGVALGENYGSTNPVFYIMATQSGYTGVAIFFFLSGYGLMESESRSHLGFKQFLLRRFWKIYFPVLLVTALWLPVSFVREASGNPLIYTLLIGGGDPVMWFVRVLMPLYAAFFVCTLIAKHTTQGVLGYIVLLLGCMATAVFDMIADDTLVLHSVPMFALGVIASRFKNLGVTRISLLIVAVGLATSIAAFATSHPLTGFTHSFFDYPVVAIMVAMVSVKRLDWRLMPLLTAIIFDLYLVHFKVYTVMSQYVSLEWFVALSLPAAFVSAWLFMNIRTSFSKLPELKRLWTR